MVTATERVNSTPLYKNNYYVSGTIMFCKFCNITIDHKNKSKIDQHLNTNKHKNNKVAIERRNIHRPQQQTTLETFEDTISERDELNLELVKVFTAADIPLEKVDKLRPFFRKYCKNGTLKFK
jgi:hypothetical protein